MVQTSEPVINTLMRVRVHPPTAQHRPVINALMRVRVHPPTAQHRPVP